MYAAAAKYIDEILVSAQRSDLPPILKPRVISLLTQIRSKALCDMDRLGPVVERQKMFYEFESLLKGTNFLEKCKSNQSGWYALEIFFEVSHMALLESAFEKKPISKESRWKNAEAADFFQYLSRRAEEKLPNLTAIECIAVRLGLYYLELESKRTRYQRNRSAIRFTWRHIQPLLRKAGLLEEFNHEPEIVRRVRSFVSDSIL